MAEAPALLQNQSKVVAVAREIAINHKPIDDILSEYKLSEEEWKAMQEAPDFVRILQSEIISWQSAENTVERTRLKAAALLEMWLEEANARLYDKDESLNSKVALAQLIEKMAGISSRGGDGDAGGGFRVVINIGGQDLTFEKTVTPKVIEGSAE